MCRRARCSLNRGITSLRVFDSLSLLIQPCDPYYSTTKIYKMNTLSLTEHYVELTATKSMHLKCLYIHCVPKTDIWLHLTSEVDKCVGFSCQIFSGFNIPKALKSVNLWQSYLKKEKGASFLGTQCTLKFALKLASVFHVRFNRCLLNWQCMSPAGCTVYHRASARTPINTPPGLKQNTSKIQSVALYQSLRPNLPVRPKLRPKFKVWS